MKMQRPTPLKHCAARLTQGIEIMTENSGHAGVKV